MADRSTKFRRVPERFSAGWLQDLDSRTALAREIRARYSALTNDLGGLERLSYQRRTLAERVVWLEYWLAMQEQHLAAGNGEFDAGKWTQACNALSGLLKTLGLDRVASDAPDLQTYLKQREQAQ